MTAFLAKRHLALASHQRFFNTAGDWGSLCTLWVYCLCAWFGAMSSTRTSRPCRSRVYIWHITCLHYCVFHLPSLTLPPSLHCSCSLSELYIWLWPGSDRRRVWWACLCQGRWAVRARGGIVVVCIQCCMFSHFSLSSSLTVRGKSGCVGSRVPLHTRWDYGPLWIDDHVCMNSFENHSSLGCEHAALRPRC